MKTTRYDPHVELPELPDYGAMPDEVLFQRIRRQDLAASSVYYSRHGAMFYGRLLALLGDRAAAEGLLEALFLQIWQRRRDLAKLGSGVTDVLIEQVTQSVLPVLRDLPEAALGDSDDRKALAARCRELDSPDLSDEVIHRCVESLVSACEPVSPPPDVRRRLSLRLGHPDVEKAARRYAQRWVWQLLLIVLIGLGLSALVVWLVWP